MKHLLVFALIVLGNALYGQKITGTVYGNSSKQPVSFANIGIVNRNVGTVSNEKGNYSLFLDKTHDSDTLLFSCIGYLPYAVSVSDLKKGNSNVILKEKAYDIKEVVVRNSRFKTKTLGVNAILKKIYAGFGDNNLGYEMGVVCKVKKRAILKRARLNIAICTYDSIFYRLNIYKITGDKCFENILTAPIYVKAAMKNASQLTISFNSRIVVDGDFLITLEHVKNMGPGKLFFCSSLLHKTYFRKTSQGKWESAPVGIGISVDAEVEQ